MNLFLQDVCGVIKRVLSFLGRQLSEDALKRVIEQCAFKNMKQNNMSNYSLVPQEHLDQSKVSFLRKGRQEKTYSNRIEKIHCLAKKKKVAHCKIS